MPQYFNFLEAVVERRADPASAASDWHWLLGSCPFSQASCCPGHQQGKLQVVQSRDRAKSPAQLQWPGPWHRALLAAQKGSSQLPGLFFFFFFPDLVHLGCWTLQSTWCDSGPAAHAAPKAASPACLFLLEAPRSHLCGLLPLLFSFSPL